ncbi:MAG TPA: tetratricopeptide repeat protein [Bacteroidota bacterium]|nr:tetratricopeptide repeat protein [Bacteroidota bacterium]
MKLRILIGMFVSFLLAASLAAQDSRENADFKLALNLYNDKLYDLAHEQLQQFVQRYPNAQQAVEARFYLGLTQSKLGKHDDARFTFQNFALSYPDNPRAPEAWWNVAESYVAQNNYREAAVSFERLKVFHPKSKMAPSALLKASDFFELAGDVTTAERMLRMLLQEYAGSDEATSARMRLAELAYVKKQYEAARTEAQRIVTTTKDADQKSRAQLLLARAFIGLERYQEAEAVLAELNKNPRSPISSEARLTHASLKKQLGNLQEAIGIWKAVAADSVQASGEIRQSALLELGDAYLARRDGASALPQFERAAGIKTNRSGEAWYKAAQVAEQLKQPQKAAEYYARALRDSSGTVDERGLFVGAFKGAILSGKYSEAKRLAGIYRARYPTDQHTPRLLFEAANIAQKQLKDSRTAIELYREIVAEYPASQQADDALFSLGTLLAQTGVLHEALELFESFERRFPASELIKRARDEAKRIRLFELKSRDAGVEKLALLIGDVIAQRPKAEMAFRLADIYFHDLKDYEQAAHQYSVALEGDLDAAKRPAAWYYQAKAYEYLAWKAVLEKGNGDRYVAQAIAAYDLLLKSYPENEFRDEAVTARAILKLQQASSLTEIRTMHTAFLKDFPTVKNKEAVLLAIGNAYRRLEGHADALEVFRTAMQSRNTSEAAEAMFQLAMTMDGMGKADSALALLQTYMATYPQYDHAAEAAWFVGKRSAERGRVQQALRAYEQLEQRYPYTQYFSELPLARADAYLAANDLPQAIDSYQRYLAVLQEDFFTLREVPLDVLLNLAQCYQRAGNRSEAKKYYTMYLNREPSSERTGDVYFALAAIARDENRLELAAKYLQEAGKLGGARSGQQVRAALEAADLLFRGEMFSEAVTRYREVAQAQVPDSVRQYALARTAVCYFRMNNAEEAEKQVSAFVKAYPRAKVALAEFEFERGRYLLRRNEFDKARVTLENVIKKYDDTPFVVDAHYWLGRVFEAAGRPQEARKQYEFLIERFPNRPVTLRARLSLGNLLYAAEQWDPAARQYKAVLDNEQLAPDLVPYAMNNLILAYKELSLFDAALELTRKYIERFPNDPELLNKRIDIGVLYQKLGYYDQSVLHLQGLLDGADADTEAELRYYIGEAYYAKGDYQQAILEFLKVPYLVTRKTKTDWTATSFYMAGQSYEKMSKFDQAISMYKQILERPGIDAQFKSAAQKEIDRVNALVKSQR